MTYRAPVSDFQFLLDQVVGYDQVAGTDRFAEADADEIVDEQKHRRGGGAHIRLHQMLERRQDRPQPDEAQRLQCEERRERHP